MSEILKGHKPLEVKSVNGKELRVDWARLPRKIERKLIDALRRSLLYQVPRPEFENPTDQHPKTLHVRIPFKHFKDIMEIIGKAGGWTLPRAARDQLQTEHQDTSSREAAIVGKEIECPGDNCDGAAVITGLMKAECVTCKSSWTHTKPLDGGPPP
ncbi:hypothetical protein LCGC14_1967490 [marine sediment metagenome]|uniref:Uncharacterized protein n=1 Tax=marine sediment metagenome TaxID=412755 RepID=A0A0F9I9Q9_9ZZZZ